ncbi:hypothetical protein Pmar_PMAR001811 [Perkinsus marinus ATCC 50983]|uniref:Uncharacterized protein n=1 Tax=Perkinsus marinus (strain ATCC 50983 / TXsc) TaxID=423536 RepID=C5LJP9_PERM5|nr:hypothetical protein Pmar_PMAR001811 [Perkinsus marinus ATCC 50983]EER03066.1 hypothetical protein Pmar_PMAR001811 [Perkinsus marinus ATCC 50983]|eukprot:XP_002771250.1 hypothetical protein Pmar_PMAR001811 [Perkinsus marinus ATCC 50983]
MSTNPQASGLPGVNMATAAFGKATLPTLGSRVDLAHHIHIVDNCLLECGLATLDTEGKVCIKPQSKYVAMSRILTSLSTVKEVAASAQRAATRFDYDWVSVKRLLTRQYCKKETLKAEYSSQLTKLRLISESDDPEPFIEKATECFALCQRAFDDDRSERRAFIRALCNRLPHDCVLSILRSVQSALLAKGLSDGDTEWETSIAFDDFDLAAREEADAPPVTAITFCSALRSSCGLAREARLLTSSPQVKTDAIKAIREAGDHPQRRPKFSEKFPFVVYVSGSLVDDRDKFPKYIATVKPTDSLRTKNKRGKPYALLGFATEEAGSSALADLQADRGLGLVVRQFQTDPPKNGSGPRQ